MRARDYFPLGIAFGSAFCNRESETEIIIKNMQSTKHTLIMAPRRYGKSSLSLHALALSQLPYTEIDFYMASNEKQVEDYILNGVQDLIGKSLGPINKLIASIKKHVKSLSPKIEIGASPFKLELVSQTNSDPASNVKEALLLLENLLKEKNKRAVLLLDEFQTVGIIAQGKGIEAAIRHVAQKTKHLTLIFSGSNRKLLKTMFEDDTRPLYKLCWKISVKRISPDHYKKHFQKAAQLAWKKSLNEEVIDRILLLTERHPFYVNKLGDRLLSHFDKRTAPHAPDVDAAWLEIVTEEKSDAVKEISSLSMGQKSLLQQIANKEGLPISGKQTMLNLKMTSSSIMTALNALEEKDLIEREAGEIQIINPVVRYFASRHA